MEVVAVPLEHMYISKQRYKRETVSIAEITAGYL
jgi:hypothetical protein